jgi:hypothetical protein
LSEPEEQQVKSALTEDFFMNRFKTHWCPIGVQHDWQSCVYAHNYQDARREVSIGYGPRPCEYWKQWTENKGEVNSLYIQRCPLGLRCPFAHGAKEQLYHPLYYRTVVCRDKSKGKNNKENGTCPRKALCAFFHSRPDRRKTPKDLTDYTKPLEPEAVDKDWADYFLAPPFADGVAGESLWGQEEVEATAPHGGAMLEQQGLLPAGLLAWNEEACDAGAAAAEANEAWRSMGSWLYVDPVPGGLPSTPPSRAAGTRHCLTLEEELAASSKKESIGGGLSSPSGFNFSGSNLSPKKVLVSSLEVSTRTYSNI